MKSRLPDRLLPAGRRLSMKAEVGSMTAVEGGRAGGSAGEDPTPTPVADGNEVYTLNDEPQPQVDFAFGFLMVKPPPVMLSTKSTSAPLR